MQGLIVGLITGAMQVDEAEPDATQPADVAPSIAPAAGAAPNPAPPAEQAQAAVADDVGHKEPVQPGAKQQPADAGRDQQQAPLELVGDVEDAEPPLGWGVYMTGECDQ
jgi:hypothetical protein